MIRFRLGNVYLDGRVPGFSTIFDNLIIGAAVLGRRIIPAGTGIHCGDEHKAGWKRMRTVDSENRHFFVLHRLAQGIQSAAGVFGKFIQKKDTIVSQRDLSRHGIGTAADQGIQGNIVVRGAERSLPDQEMIRHQTVCMQNAAVFLERICEQREKDLIIEIIGKNILSVYHPFHNVISGTGVPGTKLSRHVIPHNQKKVMIAAETEKRKRAEKGVDG